MDKEKLKLIVRNLESLVECLKTEIDSDSNSDTDSDVDTYKQEPQYENIAPYLEDYDEVFYDDENEYAN